MVYVITWLLLLVYGTVCGDAKACILHRKLDWQPQLNTLMLVISEALTELNGPFAFEISVQMQVQEPICHLDLPLLSLVWTLAAVPSLAT